MAERRWQILLGAAVLVLMLLAAAFSLGVYVGEHGWTGDALRYQPEALPGAPALPAGAGGQPNVTGRIRRLSPQSLELATPNGPRHIELTSDTRYEDEQGTTIALEDLRPGQVVAVFADVIAGDGLLLLATRIVRLPSAAPNQP
jgi:hypothetical protein